MNQKQVVSVSATDKSLIIIRDVDSPTPQLEHKGLPVISADLPDDCDDEDNPDRLSDKDGDDVDDPTDVLDDVDDIEKSVPLSSLAWEAFELSSDWSRTLKGDHGILAALDLSLPLPMCNVDISSPTNSRNILDIFSDVMDLPPLNNFIDSRLEPVDERPPPFIIDQPSTSTDDAVPIASSTAKPLRGVSVVAGGSELDRSNTLMTPQELERMPDQGLEFEQSVGPKELPTLAPAPSTDPINDGVKQSGDGRESPLTEEQMAALSSDHAPIILSGKGQELTTITVHTSHGEKMFKVNTGQLREAAAMMRPVIINASDDDTTITLVMLPVSKVKLLPPDKGTNDGPKYRCLQCERTFPRSYSLRLHEMMKHAVEKPYKCPRPGCKWAFTDAYRLRNHERSHLKIKDHVCDSCGKRYASIWNLRTHQDMLHNDRNRAIECELCELTFTAESKLHKHYREVHPDKPKEFRCPEEDCGEQFHSKLGLTRHMLGHKKRDSMALTCPIEGCGKTFKWKSRYDIHLRNHNDDRPFKCTFHGCTATFTTGSALNRHSKRHSESKAFVCDICTKSFNRPDHLKNHLAMHSGQKPYKCPEEGCKMAFPTRSALLMHLKRHAVRANRVMLICPDAHCEAKFSTKPQLIKHINAHHPLVMEKQYSLELAEAAGGQEDIIMDETVIATSSVADTGAIDWNFDLPNQSHQGLTVVNTKVGKKHIELILPAPLLAEADAASRVISSPLQERSEKGSARTDNSVNSEMCHKARQRQQQQKEQAMLPLSTTHIPTPMEISSSVAQVIPGSIDIYNSVAGSDVVTTTQPIASVVDSVVEGDDVTENSVVVSASMVAGESNIVSADGTITTSLDQWLTTVNQEGVVVGDQTLVTATDQDLVRYTFTSQIEDNPDLSNILDDFSSNQ